MSAEMGQKETVKKKTEAKATVQRKPDKNPIFVKKN